MLRLRDTDTLPELADAQCVEAYVRQVSDTIYDPCGMAMGINIGMNQMGLVRKISSAKNAGGTWEIAVTLRLTAPGCEYFFAFKDNLQQGLAGHSQIAAVEVEWDPTLDWTPEDLAPDARARLDERRRELWQQRAGAPRAQRGRSVKLEVGEPGE